MEQFGEFLREHTIKIIKFEKKSMIPLTIKWQESYEKYICKKQFEHKYNKDKSYHKVQDHCHYMLNTELLLIAYAI